MQALRYSKPVPNKPRRNPNPNYAATLTPGGKTWWRTKDATPSMLLNLADVGRHLGFSKRKVAEMIKAHEIPVVVVGRQIRVPRMWIEKQCLEAVDKHEARQKAELAHQAEAAVKQKK
jgi:excisionase family DNA binding protein